MQTIIAFYQSTNDTLRGFTAGDVRFVVVSKGPLNLVAITRIPESDSQLRGQLDALYMQVLSTLTLPSIERMFAARANYDLRRPLQGTETLLSALADGFTRGSPSALLSALECLKLRKTHRQTINNTLLKTRSENLLYGLIVASGKLVSVVRPKKHSLHPGDLHLIFNMLFEAGSVKAGGGENWIPLCLPGFNNTGYLYMYVSFLDLERPGEPVQERPKSREGDPDEVAILLISANKEGFFELRGMRDELVEVRYAPFSLIRRFACTRIRGRHARSALPHGVSTASAPGRRAQSRGMRFGEVLIRTMPMAFGAQMAFVRRRHATSVPPRRRPRRRRSCRQCRFPGTQIRTLAIRWPTSHEDGIGRVANALYSNCKRTGPLKRYERRSDRGVLNAPTLCPARY